MFGTSYLFDSRLVKCFPERPRSLDQQVPDAVMRNRTGEAIVDGEVRTSYEVLDSIVDRIAASLAARGIVKGDCITLLLRNPAAFVELV